MPHARDDFTEKRLHLGNPQITFTYPLNSPSDKVVIQVESQKQHLSVSAFDNDNQRHDNHDDNIDVDGNA